MGKKVIIIGAGGVGNVVAKKCAMNPAFFSEVILASRTLKKCDAIAAEAKQIIKERKENPQAWPLEEARMAEAFLAAYEAKTRVPSSPRAGGRRD
jgi:saccharopine dehydrogenase-like NADP-dependent oxidoreductase